jgi:hypothetical protein
MSKSQPAFAIERGTLHLELGLDLRTLAAAAAFAAIAVAEIAVVTGAAAGFDPSQLRFTI